MILVRPVALADHAEILALAHEAGIGMTSLPPDEHVLGAKIEHSVKSCQSEVHPNDAAYLFVLEDTALKKLVGTAGIIAHVGMRRPFYSYKLSIIVQASARLGIYSYHRVLHMVNDYTGATEVGSLFLLPSHRRDGIGTFLSRCRYLMMAELPELFSDIVISEIRGVQDENGDSPFYKNLAQHFFQMDFKRADFVHATQGGQFISDLMPKYPVYVNLLNQKAQDVIGVPFSASLPAMRLLEKEGFRYQGYIDVFDAGPTMQVERAVIRTVRKSKRNVVLGTKQLPNASKYMVATTSLEHFKIAFTEVEDTPEGIYLTSEAADTLGVKAGDTVRFIES